MLGFIGLLFGALGGFVAGSALTQSAIGGGIGAAILGFLFKQVGGWVGRTAFSREVEAVEIGGENRSAGWAIFWWLTLFGLGAAGLVLYGLGSQ